MKVVIVGAGIAGLSVARALVARGCRPLVIAGEDGASPAGAGIVSAQMWDASLLPAARRSQEILRESVQIERCGMAQIALTEASARKLERLEGVSEGLPSKLSRALAPAFQRRIVRATFAKNDFWVRWTDVRRAFSRGVRVVRARVKAVARDRVITDRSCERADHVVLAAGAGSRRLLRGLALFERRSELARTDAAIPAMLHVLDSGLYMRPDGAGSLAGDGDAPWRDRGHGDGLLPTVAFARRAALECAALFGAVPRSRPRSAGAIAFTRTRRPIARTMEGIHVLAGLGGDGLALAPALGEAIAEGILQRETSRNFAKTYG